MTIKKSYRYVNYGPIPQNEYTVFKSEDSTGADAALEHGPNTDEIAYKQRLVKRQALHSSGRKNGSGWARAGNANGWRAESAALHDEFIDAA